MTRFFVISILSYISNEFHRFYALVTRCRFGEVAKHATDLLPHEALKAAHVHETTLCVTFGARRRWVPLNLLDRRLASGPPKLPKNSGPVPADGRFGCRGRPEMPVSTLTSADLQSGILRRQGRHAHVVTT